MNTTAANSSLSASRANTLDSSVVNTLAAMALSVSRGGRAILHPIDVRFKAGEVTAVLGPNGAGKSTLLACLAGLLSPQEGDVRLDDVSITRMAARDRAKRIGFLPQLPEVAWPVDVTTLVGLGRIPYGRTASEAENTGAVTRALAMTATTQWSSREVGTLSGGERARVLFARLIAGEPQWVLADEPFAGLDPAHQFEMAELLRQLAAAGRGVVFTLHDLTLAARVADRVVLLCDGRIMADGSPQAALTPTTLRRAYGIEAQWVNGSGLGASPMIAILGRCSERKVEPAPLRDHSAAPVISSEAAR